MIFDQLCGIAERYLPDLIPILRKVRIFIFDVDPRSTPIKVRNPDQLDGIFMPYSTTLFHFENCLYVIEDTLKDQTGASQKRRFISVDRFETKDKEKCLLICVGSFVQKKYDDINGFGTMIEGLVDEAFAGDKRYFRSFDKIDIAYDEIDKMHNDCLRNVKAVVDFAQRINSSENFILETRPVKTRKSKKSDKISRIHQRPTYTLLHPDKIREQMGLPDPGIGTGVGLRPHERRRHVRYLSNSKYRFDDRGVPIEPRAIPSGPRRGELYYKRIDVPATWIGPSESRRRNKIYRVILDR